MYIKISLDLNLLHFEKTTEWIYFYKNLTSKKKIQYYKSTSLSLAKNESLYFHKNVR